MTTKLSFDINSATSAGGADDHTATPHVPDLRGAAGPSSGLKKATVKAAAGARGPMRQRQVPHQALRRPARCRDGFVTDHRSSSAPQVPNV